MRCPTCQATNPDSAAFCGQCYERFAQPADPRPDPVEDTPVHGLDLPTPDTPTTPAATTGATGSTASSGAEPTVAVGRFASDGGALTWRCAVCDTTHPFGEFTCTVCGARIDAESADGDTADVDVEAVRRLEAAVPGLGHVKAGHGGMGLARGGIVAVWLLGVLALVTGGSTGLLIAAPLVLGMAVIWLTGPADLGAAIAGRRPVLDARRYMYLVIGVTTGVIAAGGLAVL